MIGLRTDVPLAAPSSDVARGGSSFPACPNCGSAHVAAFCADCGERQPSHHDFTVRALVLDAVHELVSVDGRLLRSVVALVTRPGLLTREWFEGRRGRYVKPFSLFLLLNVAFFVIQPRTKLLSYGYENYTFGGNAGAVHRRALVEEKRRALAEDSVAFRARFEQELQGQKKTLMAFYVPVVALILAALYAWRGRPLAEHLVFSVHLWAYMLVALSTIAAVLILVLKPVLSGALLSPRLAHFLDSDGGITLLLGTVVVTYLYKAFRRVYGDRPIPALVRAGITFYLIGYLTNVYHDVLFYTTLYSL